MKRIRATLVIVSVVTAAGCTADGGPGAPSTGLLDPLDPPSGLALDLLSCTPLPYDSASRTIGPAGGTITVGPHSFVVPAGALADTVTITAIAPSDTVNRVILRPAGLQFQSKASLVMSYANCDLLGLLLPKRIAHVTSAFGLIDYLSALDNLFAQTVTGKLDHFSQYAVAW